MIKDELKEYFNQFSEEKNRSRQRGIYKFYCMLGYTIEGGEHQRGLDDILADVRALPNVTIVTVVVSNQPIADKRYVAGISVKFIPSVIGEFRAPEEVKSTIMRGMRKVKNLERIFKVSTSPERIE